MELSQDEKAAAEFINGVIPNDLAEQAKQMKPELFNK